MKNKRTFKNYLLNKDFQLNIILYNLFYLVCASILCSGIILFPDFLTMLFSSDSELKYKAALNFLSFGSRIVPGIIALLILSFIHMTILTHRICGPLVHFANLIKEFKKGNLNARIRLRKDDYLKSESGEVNEVAENLQNYFRELKENVEHAKKKLESKEDISADLEKIYEKLSIFS